MRLSHFYAGPKSENNITYHIKVKNENVSCFRYLADFIRGSFGGT